MPYKAKGVANALINKSLERRNEKLSHMKLQKLLYYACGYYLVAKGSPLIDHTFEAWEYGPVVPVIYHEFKHLGAKPITTLASELDWDTGGEVTVPIPTGDPVLDRVLDFVVDSYGKYSAVQLSEMTHAAGSPWDRTRKENPGIRDADIPRQYLIEHFEKFVKKPKKSDA